MPCSTQRSAERFAHVGRVADLAGEAAPVGVVAVQGGAHQRRAGHQPGDAARRVADAAPGDLDGGDLGRPLAVAGDEPGQPAGHLFHLLGPVGARPWPLRVESSRKVSLVLVWVSTCTALKLLRGDGGQRPPTARRARRGRWPRTPAWWPCWAQSCPRPCTRRPPRPRRRARTPPWGTRRWS